MSYRDRTRRLINLPSGATASIRKLCARDFIEFGNIPDVLSGKAKEGRAPSKQEIEWGDKCVRVMLTRCCSRIQSEGQSFRIVDAPFADCKDDEISIEEMDQADAQAIVNAVQEFSGLTKEAAQRAKPFPEKSPAAYQPSPDGENLPSSAINDPQPVHS
jgi:hypothetical protein